LKHVSKEETHVTDLQTHSFICDVKIQYKCTWSWVQIQLLASVLLGSPHASGWFDPIHRSPSV